MSLNSTGNKTVDEIGKIHFEGNIIPHAWYQTLRLESGKPDLVAMILLSDFVYWHRPTIVRDEQTGQVTATKKKFKADLLQKSYKSLTEQFGFSDKQIREALKRLEDKQVLKRVLKTIDTPIGKLPNMLFIKLNVSGLVKITFPESKDIFPSKETPIDTQGNTITDITTQNSSNKSSSSKAVDISTIMDFWDTNGFGFNNITTKQKFLAYLDDGFTEEVLLKALVVACEENKRSFSYLKGILHNWEKADAKSIQAVEAHLAEFQANKEQRTSQWKGAAASAKDQAAEQSANDYQLPF
ncbi:DnaD domain-containing protein [Bacillus weihaiensis]|uniref:DnaD domain-containing protein n=1 Tax=Bacillus weihaiensis TaxID=1547283 RepID=UPI002357916D|nr:DnaD domain protein [Bacillus weihaiensis]